MSVRRATLLGAVVLYLVLWGLVADGATGLIEPLLIPIVLAVIVALGVWFQRFMGLEPRRSRFDERDDEDEQ